MWTMECRLAELVLSDLPAEAGQHGIPSLRGTAPFATMELPRGAGASAVCPLYIDPGNLPDGFRPGFASDPGRKTAVQAVASDLVPPRSIIEPGVPSRW